MPDKPKGPASYFPSIEAKYGRPVGEWLEVLQSSGLDQHKAMVDWLKAEHGMGHGHATALVAHYRAHGTDPAA